MLTRRSAWIYAILPTLLAGFDPASAVQELSSPAPYVEPAQPSIAPRATGDPGARLEDLRGRLARFDRDRIRDLESRYEKNGDQEKRLLERRFGVIEHRFRVDADPREILHRWQDGLAPGVREDPGRLVRILDEITEGRYAAYYFFDAVIRPNVFAPDARLEQRESTVHERVHLIQPSVYKALGLHCVWIDRYDPCVQSLEPVAVYLTEYAILKRSHPQRTDASVNRAIRAYLDLEVARCRYPTGVPRCPAPYQVTEYILLPRELSRVVERRGLEDGIRRFVANLARPASLAGGH